MKWFVLGVLALFLLVAIMLDLFLLVAIMLDGRSGEKDANDDNFPDDMFGDDYSRRTMNDGPRDWRDDQRDEDVGR